MPAQEVFMEEKVADRTISVLKTYDMAFAREAFDGMEPEALRRLVETLDLERTFEPEDVPSKSDPGYSDFVWDEFIEAAREDGSRLSFFVVTEQRDTTLQSLYASPDWPSSEAFALMAIQNG